MQHRFPRPGAGDSSPAVGSRLASERTARAAFIRTTPKSLPISLFDHPLTAPSVGLRAMASPLRVALSSGYGTARENRGQECRKSSDFDLATCDGEMLYWTIETSGVVLTGISRWIRRLPVGQELGTQSRRDRTTSSAGSAVARSHRDTLNRWRSGPRTEQVEETQVR